MADSTSSVGVLSNIFTAPSLAFAAIKERPNPWVPLLVLMIAVFVVQFTYMQVVDFPWLIDQQLQQAGANMTDAQRAQVVDATTRVPPSVLGVIQGADPGSRGIDAGRGAFLHRPGPGRGQPVPAGPG